MSVLESELSDTLSLDYQRSSHPTQYPTIFLDIALDISPRLATLASHFVKREKQFVAVFAQKVLIFSQSVV